MAPLARGARRTLLGLGVLGVASVKLAKDFNRTSTQMVGLAGVGERQVDRWKEAMLDLAPIVGKAPRELAEALYFVSSSGVDTAKAFDVLDKAARASASGLGETQIVADAVTSAMNAYGEGVLTAAQATDVLVATVREGKGEADAMAPVLGNILPIAAELGVGFNQVGAAMASMTRLGTDASTAATNISATFSALLKPSVGAKEAFKDMGTSAGELRRQLAEEGLLATLQTLAEATDGNAAAMAKAFPNVRALRGVLQLVGKSAESTEQVFKSMEDTTGALGTAFRATAEDDAFKMEQSMAEVQAAGVRMGAELLPVAADIGSAFASGVTFLAEHETATKGAAAAIAGLSVAIIGANTALKIYNSQLVAATIGKSALLGAARFAGPIGILALAVGGAALAIRHFTSDTDEASVAMQGATTAARDYRTALLELRGANDTYKDAQLRLKRAELGVAQARKANRQVLRDHPKRSLAARDASLRLAEAERELERATKDAGVAHRDARGAKTRVGLAASKARQHVMDLRDAIKTEKDVMGELPAAALGGAAAMRNFTRATDAKAAGRFAGQVGTVAQELGGAQTKAGRAALEVQKLTRDLGRVPTKTEINVALRTAEAYARAREIHDYVSRPAYKDVILRPVGTTGVQPRQAGGPVMPGGAYVVGEQRPELLVMGSRGGYVYPSVGGRHADGGGLELVEGRIRGTLDLGGGLEGRIDARIDGKARRGRTAVRMGS